MLRCLAAATLSLIAIAHAAPEAAAQDKVAERNMPAYCRGMASSEFGVNPRDIESGSVDERRRAFIVEGTYRASGGARRPFRCRFGKSGEFRFVKATDDAGNAPKRAQISACNDMLLGTGKVVESTPLKPGAFELVMDFPDGSYVCDVEADGKVTYFDKLR
jgi:hypothetical protein